MASSMATLSWFSHPANWNEMHHNILGHVMPLMLVLVSHYANSVINGTTQFVRTGWSEGDETCLLVMWCHWHHHCTMICQWHHQWHHCISLVKVTKMGCNIGTGAGNICCQTIKNYTIAFLRSRKLKWGATWHFGNWVPLALTSMSNHANSIINGTIAFLRISQLKWGIWLFVMWCH